MNINVLRSLPENFGIAFSGGIDSAVMLDVALRRNKRVGIYTFDHKTETSAREVSFAIETARRLSIPINICESVRIPKKGESKEAAWRNERYEWFHSFGCLPIATGHHLNDVAEWYLMTALAGKGGHIITYDNKNVIRPLLACSKKLICEYAEHYGVPYIEDPTNNDVTFNARNKIRHNVMPVVMDYNPGFLNSIKRFIVKREKD